MTNGNDSELEALRKRAYGPRPDIHLDAGAANRLRELETESRRQVNPVPSGQEEAAPSEPASATVGEGSEGANAGDNAEPAGSDWSWAREVFNRLMMVRQSTALILLSAVVAVVLAMTSLTFLQRVQDDPLQVGAERIARLSIDSSYKIPEFFASSSGEGRVEGFEDFYGLRTVAAYGTTTLFLDGGSGDCLSVFSSADMKPGTNSSGGFLVGGCGAGGFPAITQFGVRAQDAPEELRSAFPDSTAFQFVLDVDNKEVVVFMTK